MCCSNITAKVVIDTELRVIALDKDDVLEPKEGVEMVREAWPGKSESEPEPSSNGLKSESSSA